MKRIWDRLLGRADLGRMARQVRAEGLTYLSEAKFDRLRAEIVRLRRDAVAGDFVEFGLALGGSGLVLARAARDQGRAFAGYDVFGMIPPPTSDKDDSRSRERYEVIRSGKAKGLRGGEYYGYVDDLYDRVTATFARYGLPPDGNRLRLVRGLFENSWPETPVERVALAHLDCDWYDPVKYCLHAVADRVSPGGVIVLDDYNDYGGCRTATDEFLAQRPDYRRIDGANLILRRTA